MSGYDTPDNPDDVYGLELEYDQDPAHDPRESDEVLILPIEDVPCKQCGYDLSGLHETGLCPECGYPIERSLTEDLLEFSAPGYLASLHLGVFLVLVALTLKFILFISMFSLAISIGMSGGNMNVLFLGSLISGFLASILIAIGWWKFSAPDPAFTGQINGSTARKVVRVTTLIIAGVAVINLPIQLLTMNTFTGGLIALSQILGVISAIAWVTGFFAGMVYLRWLAPRIPEWRIFNRAKMLMWLEPILFTVGWVCLAIGPLVGFVLYWGLFNLVRLEIKAIRKEAERGQGIVYTSVNS